MNATPEIFAVIRAGDADRLKALLAADPALARARSERGHTPLMVAQYHRRRDLVEILAAASGDLGFFDAAAVGRTARVAALLDADRDLIEARSADGFTALHYAAYFGHAETAQLLLSRGASVAMVADNPMRVQPLHAAVSNRHAAVARVLVHAGAPVNARQQEGWSPLQGAVHNGDVEMIRLLLAAGADPKQPNDAGKSAIGLAADAGNTEILKLLKSPP